MSLLASAVLYGVGSYLFWFNKTLITVDSLYCFWVLFKDKVQKMKEEEEE